METHPAHAFSLKIDAEKTTTSSNDSVGLSYGDLELLKSECKDREEFVRILKDRGINSKPLQEKLSKHFKYSQRK